MSRTDEAAPADPVDAGPAGAGGDRPAAGLSVGRSAGLVAAGTDPYPWPWDGRFTPRRCALLVVTDGTAIGDPAVAGVLAALADRVRCAGALVVRVETGRRARGAGPARGAAGPGDGALLADRPGDGAAAGAGWPDGTSVTAAGWDGFYGSPLDAVLRAAGRDQLLLAGRLLETGVHSTLRSANDRGYECLTLGDACEAGTAETGRGALSSITMSGGIFGATGSAADVLALLGASPASS